MRADVFLYSRGFAKSRTHASELINGGVLINGKKIPKPSFEVSENEDTANIVILSPAKYVSRGGLKLEAALSAFRIDVKGLTVLDIGASTGGFTDCLLKHGAARVYAVDVGHGQLDTSLLNDSRVSNFEGVNARYMTSADIGYSDFPLAVSDISFISQSFIYETVSSLLSKDGDFISLIKPQFECGKENLSSGGICRDKKIHIKTISTLCSKATLFGLNPYGFIRSPISGGDGNTEYLVLFTKRNVQNTLPSSLIEKAIMGDSK